MKTDNEIIIMVLELFIIKQRKTMSWYAKEGIADTVFSREEDIYLANNILNKLKYGQGQIN